MNNPCFVLWFNDFFVILNKDNRMNKQNNTEQAYKNVISKCLELFEKKTKDYGTAWRILRLPSLTDQIFIKAQRVRSIQEKGKQKIDENISDEFIAIVNYCLIALIQISLKDDDRTEIPPHEVLKAYKKEADATRELLLNKNHDYGEAWRDMRITSITDIILMKIYRTKQIEDHNGHTIASEGVDANYRDMINYSVFCLIKMGFHE